MRYLLALVALLAAAAIAGPPLYHTHALPLVPAAIAGPLLALAFFLADPADVAAFLAEARTTFTCWFKRGAP